jgi:prepilin-type N-terminal cleavage/methylation domain-containing protein
MLFRYFVFSKRGNKSRAQLSLRHVVESAVACCVTGVGHAHCRRTCEAIMKTALRNGFTLIEIMVVVAIIGLLASIAIPNLKHAIDRSRQQVCAVNRKNIDGAKLQWALDHKEPLTATPADEDLFGESRYIDHKPDCPARGEYSLNAVGEKCTCNASLHSN